MQIKKKNVDEIADLAVEALLYEVGISPKAGLVTKFSNGSHKDMDFNTFQNSAHSLREYFKDCFNHYEKFDFESEEFFKNLRLVGKNAEAIMLKATNGINTHKGTIFSMGILIATISACMKKEELNLFEISQNIKRICEPLKNELGLILENSKGEQIYSKYKIKGARGLALSGYSIVLNDGIEKLFKFLEKLDLETSCILLLFYYMSVLDDTNIISRSNIKTLEKVQEETGKIFVKNLKNLSEEDIKKDMSDLNENFVQKNISPGGSADLLILTIFLYFLTR